MEECRKSHDRRSHMGEDAESASERSDDAGARAARQTGRQRVENAGAGRHDHDQRGHEEGDAHGRTSWQWG